MRLLPIKQQEEPIWSTWRSPHMQGLLK